jgi:hypothetical protein
MLFLRQLLFFLPFGNKHKLMKKIMLNAFLGIGFLLALQPANAISGTNSIILTNSPIATKADPLNEILIKQFLSLTPKKYYELTGKKMKLSQKISLKLAQHKVKSMIKKGKTVDLVAMSKGIDTSDFNLVGFLLGLILSLIGVLFAYLIDDESVIKWAWIGAGIGAIIFLLAILL